MLWHDGGGWNLLAFSLVASFGWILVPARGGGSWSATAVYLGFLASVLAHPFGWACCGIQILSGIIFVKC